MCGSGLRVHKPFAFGSSDLLPAILVVGLRLLVFLTGGGKLWYRDLLCLAVDEDYES